jgi:Fur family peroxide stress response transcriptional regulator
MSKKRRKLTGTRRTPQRLAILEFLERDTSHPSAEDIHWALSPRFPTMSLSTVYNALKALRREGRVSEISVEPGKARFDPETAPHHHIVCLSCRKIVDCRPAVPVELAPADAHGFEIVRSQVDFFGYCPECRAKSKSKSKSKSKKTRREES